MAAGNHRLTFGIHAERIDLVDDVLDVPGGVWTFGSLDSLAQGTAASYLAGLLHRGRLTGRISGEPDRRLRAGPVGADAAPDGDRRSPPRCALRPDATRTQRHRGERAGHQYVADAERERALVSQARRELRPSGTGDDRVARRGGILRGPPRLRVVQERVRDRRYPRARHRLRGRRACRPSRSTRRTNPPACAEPSPLAFPLAYFDPDFRFPRNLKVALGMDRLYPGASSARWISCTPAS